MNRGHPHHVHNRIYILKKYLTGLFFHLKISKKRLCAGKIIRNKKVLKCTVVNYFRQSFNYKCKKIQTL